MLFPANLLASSKKTKSKTGEAATKIYNNPRLMQIPKSNNKNHSSETKKTKRKR